MELRRMAIRAFCLLFFLARCDDGEETRRGKRSPAHDRRDRNYCRICHNHTMCLFPYEREGADCVNVENGNLDGRDIQTVLDSHNFYRVAIASGKETRGNPGPQPAARTMMELIWDDELAVIARRWALQCKLFEKDQCRDVERFGVWQNVNVLDMDSAAGTTSAERIHFHITSWYDEVEDFDNAKVGLVNYSGAPSWQLSSYIPIASATFIYVGCGRAIYTLDLNKTAAGGYQRPDAVTPGGFGNRVEVLVCNYGPVDRIAPSQLYELGQPGLCPPGTLYSNRYQPLCRIVQDSLLPNRRFVMRNDQRTRTTLCPCCAIGISLTQLLLPLLLLHQTI